MFILTNIEGAFRTLLFTIDQVAYSLIDDAYDLINIFSKAEFFKSSAVKGIMQSTYVIIGLFALFKMAVLLVNAIVSPDKLFDKDKGFVVIIRNVVIMFALLIFVPILFTESMNVQSTIVEGGYINKLFGLYVPDSYNPGEMFKSQAILALVHPNEAFAKYDENKNEYVPIDNICKDDSTHCKEAIDDYNKALYGTPEEKDHMFATLINHIGDYADDANGEKTYIYDYTMFLTFIVGVAITYLLILFCFDIAERVIKLAILEVISPLFIVTYIDPKSAKSGPFKNWLKEVGSTYASLYVRLAALALIIILTTLWQERNKEITGQLGFWGNVIFILSILIFAKNFPKWLSSLIGIKDFNGGLGGLGKRLGSAAVVGGMLTKAGHATVGATAGAVRTTHAYRKAKKVGLSSENDRAHNRLKTNYSSNKTSGDNKITSAAKAIGQTYFKKDAMKQNLKNFGTTAAAGGLGFMKGVVSGGKIGATGGSIKDINAKVKADAKGSFNELTPGYTSFPNRVGNFVSGLHGKGVESIIGNDFELDKRKKVAEKSQKAKDFFGTVTTRSDGKRDTYANPVNSLETNELIKHTNTKYKTKFDASSMEGITSSLILSNQDKIKGNVSVVDGKIQIDGKKVDTAKVCRENGIYTPYGEKTLESIAKENAYTKASEYVGNQKNISDANKSAVQAATQMQSLIGEMKTALNGSKKDITKQLSEIGNCLNNEYNANLELNKALANNADSSTISRIKTELADAVDNKNNAAKELKKVILDSGADSGLVDSFMAAASLRSNAFSQIDSLNKRNNDIKDEVIRSLEEANVNGTNSNFTAVDITTGQSYTFLQDSTQNELVSNLMNKAVAKAKDDASKLKPKTSDDKK